MKKYRYDKVGECFKKGRGKPLYVTSSEASRIANMVNLGYTNKRINSKVILSNPKSGRTTVDNFVRHYRKGEIKVPESTQLVFKGNSKEIELEDRIKGLEKMIAEMKDDESQPTLKERMKKWLKG